MVFQSDRPFKFGNLVAGSNFALNAGISQDFSVTQVI